MAIAPKTITCIESIKSFIDFMSKPNPITNLGPR